MNIGQKSKTRGAIPYKADFTKPLDVLFHCHTTIASNLEKLRAAVESMVVEPADYRNGLDMARNTLETFKSVGLKHTRDEEDSLFPRIREYRDHGVDELFEVLGQLESQHKRAASIENSFGRMLEDLGKVPEPDNNRLALIADLSESLYDLYRPHIQIENEFVFPTAAKILSSEDSLNIGREMFSRRKRGIRGLNNHA